MFNKPVMRRRLESRKRVKGRSSANSASRIFSGAGRKGARDAGLIENITNLNISSGGQINEKQAEGGQESIVQGAATLQDNQQAIDDITSGKPQKFDPSKYISEDFLQILNEHRKNCEREGKLTHATLARKRLKELRIFEEKKRKEETFNRHVSSLCVCCSRAHPRD